MLEVARRCPGCGIDVRDLTDGKVVDHPDPTTKLQRLRRVATAVGMITMVTIFITLAAIGATAVTLFGLFMWA